MRLAHFIRRVAEYFVGVLMALMFLTFVLQITIRYTAKFEWISEALPWLNPSLYGWTLEFCLVLWLWIIFVGCALVVRDHEHVTFDILSSSVPSGIRRLFILFGSIVICIGLVLSIEPTIDKFHILRLKKTATLSGLFGDWIRMRHLYSVYIVFLVVVSIRYAWAAWCALTNAQTYNPVEHQSHER